MCALTANNQAGEAPMDMVTLWSELKTSFEALSETDRNSLTSAVANESGSLLEQAAARYDMIMGKYVGLNNFMSRSIASMSNNALNILNNGMNSYIIIIAVAAILLGGCGLVIKFKKKHN